MAKVSTIIAIISLAKVDTFSDLSNSKMMPIAARLMIEKIVTTAVIARGKHCTSCDHIKPIANDIPILILIES